MNADSKTSPEIPKTVSDPATPQVGKEEETLIVGGLRVIERGLLITVAVMTLGAAGDRRGRHRPGRQAVTQPS